KVLFQGQPVTEGEVNFYCGERGAGAVATIDSGGKFTFAAPLRPGTYTAAVLPATKDPVPGAPPPLNAAPNIPRRYRDLTTSGLTFTVNPGSNDFTIEMARRGAFSPEHLQQRLPHHPWVGVAARPQADADDALVDQHPQPVEHLAAARLRLADQARPRRVGDHVADDHARPQRGDIER